MKVRKHFSRLFLLSLLLGSLACNSGSDEALTLRQKELDLKERELAVREREDSLKNLPSKEVQATEPSSVQQDTVNVPVRDTAAVYRYTKQFLADRYPLSFRIGYNEIGLKAAIVDFNSQTTYQMWEDLTQVIRTTSASEVEWVTKGLDRKHVVYVATYNSTPTVVIKWKCGRAVLFDKE